MDAHFKEHNSNFRIEQRKNIFKNIKRKGTK